MKIISRYPFETIFTFVIGYYVGLVTFFEPVNLWNKIAFSGTAFLIFLLMLIFSSTYRQEVDQYRKTYFLVFLTDKFQRSNFILKAFYLLKLSLFPFIISSLMEFLVTFLFTSYGFINFGFPLPIYSFTALRILPLNVFVDLIAFASTVGFVGYILIHTPIDE